MIKPFEFNQLGTARNFAARCHKPHMIILGDNELFWVVTLAEAARLLRKGYEMAS